jgi:hypothetical protein
MAIGIRPWLGGSGGNYGGEDAGPDLVHPLRAGRRAVADERARRSGMPSGEEAMAWLNRHPRPNAQRQPRSGCQAATGRGGAGGFERGGIVVEVAPLPSGFGAVIQSADTVTLPADFAVDQNL